ncbi:MAG: YlmH/Sll1252 family protein [Eubacteriales bacterium]|nr:YlmH/Sll1252 family protein [Eubacteriales bacterium]
MNQDELLIGKIEDKINQADLRYMLTWGTFLDTHQRKVCEDYCKSKRLPVKVIFYGGYEDAERCIPVFLPDYVKIPSDDQYVDMPQEVTELLKVVRVSAPKGSRQLSHRDYLGSLLSLGLDREVTGDILVKSSDDKTAGGADIIVQAEIADFIELNYAKAGRTKLKVEVLPIEKLDAGTVKIEQKQDTVASLRLDSIVASAFGLSRTKASEAIRRGIVSVNSLEANKLDMEITRSDKIVMKGRGKVMLSEVGGTNRKDRVRVTFSVYK